MREALTDMTDGQKEVLLATPLFCGIAAADAEALTQGLLQEFAGAPAEQVRADVEEFLARLRELGIVE